VTGDNHTDAPPRNIMAANAPAKVEKKGALGQTGEAFFLLKNMGGTVQ